MFLLNVDSRKGSFPAAVYVFSGMIHPGKHFGVIRDAGDATASGGGQACGGAGKAHHIPEGFLIQPVRGFFTLQQLPDRAAAEDIPGTGGVDDRNASFLSFSIQRKRKGK